MRRISTTRLDLIQTCLQAFIWLAVLVAFVMVSGCSAIEKLPEGAQLQTHTFGIKVSPQALDGTPLALGSHTTIITTAQPVEAGPNVNRSEIQAPMGIRVKSTVASGPVGEQLEAAGGVAAIESLVNGQPPPPDGETGVSPGLADGEPGED